MINFRGLLLRCNRHCHHYHHRRPNRLTVSLPLSYPNEVRRQSQPSFQNYVTNSPCNRSTLPLLSSSLSSSLLLCRSFSTQMEEDEGNSDFADFLDDPTLNAANNMVTPSHTTTTTDTTTTTTDTALANTMNDPIRTSLLMELTDRVGILHDVLRFFWKNDVNMTRIESRPCAQYGKFDYFVDLEGQKGDTNVDQLLKDLKRFEGLDKLLILDEKEGKQETWD